MFAFKTLNPYYLLLQQTAAGLSEAEKTEAEIAKLQAAIKEMKTKNTGKKDPGQDMFQRMKSKMVFFQALRQLLFCIVDLDNLPHGMLITS